MIRITKRTPLLILALLTIVGMATAQSQQRPQRTISVQGYAGEAPVVQIEGRSLVDLQELARITNGSLTFKRERIVLTLPRPDGATSEGDDTRKPGFSRAFMSAAIEAMASIREWGGMLMITVQNGYPVGNTMAGNTIMAYQGRAEDNVALASAAASTDSDHRGLELLRNEFGSVQAWADNFIRARSSMSATKLTMSENAVKQDPEVERMIRCGQFLAQMFASGTFQDGSACR